ncbi:cobalt-precorrin-6A reductase [Ochrobactrum pecoris]|uniref:Cobalt-precorrin-6A reductase n=1 Tax=Brucella pecoris TaxID=867683 RepID=A0A5C5CFV0_9HYPH|nr:cobalt-precorrin-6A reductase [Brucella pecoris]MBB4094278.1 precorrin-6A/cobalt-precorrin-6A reductase [Brucella pecoris]NKW80045.1 cobalt-precorrin-6A reductase [Brucella pecoris]TNV10008.1 cobalt-precorrin-6A reductase [Brucella pecoris]
MRASDPKILILGGTAEAAALATAFAKLPVNAITSLAGRTSNPAKLTGTVRSGGFGGIDGLAAYLDSEGIDLIIDATHPYAARISQNAIQAAGKRGIPLVRLERPAWEKKPQDHWVDISDEAEAANAIPSGERVFLALGRQHIAPFAERADVHFIIRMIDPPDVTLPQDCEIVLARPGDYTAERHFLENRRIGRIVSRNSGGTISYAKIEAARALGLPVMMIARPPVAARNVVALPEDAIVFARTALGF